MPPTEVHGCGCTYTKALEDAKFAVCTHLCDLHKDEYILKLFNAQAVVRNVREERMKKLREAVQKNKIKDKKIIIDGNNGGGGGGSHNKPDKGKDK